jgi:hypothetical protein
MIRYVAVVFTAIALMLAAMTGLSAESYRCGAKLVMEGDHRFDVLRKCGEPIVQDVVGFSVTRKGDRELVIEKWVYGPEHGFFTVLIFTGGVLTEIQLVRE